LNVIDKLREKIASQGLHKVLAERLRKEGHDVSEVGDLATAVRLLGERIYEKNAEYRRIFEGIAALEEVQK
jgi:hypothetical protein